MSAKVAIKVKGSIKDVKKAIRNLAAAPEKSVPLRDADARTRLKKERG